MMFVNEPLDLQMTESLSGLSCVAANVLHIFGAGPPSPGDWRWVDARIGRGSGGFASHARVCRLFDDCGLQMYLAGEHNPSRVVSEGLSYLQEYYAREWDESWDRYWTPENVAKAQTDSQIYLNLSAVGHKSYVRSVSLSDVTFFARCGSAVMIAARNGHSEQCQWWLVFGYEDNSFKIYAPRFDGDTLFECSRPYLARWWLPSEGVTAVWR